MYYTVSFNAFKHAIGHSGGCYGFSAFLGFLKSYSKWHMLGQSLGYPAAPTKTPSPLIFGHRTGLEPGYARRQAKTQWHVLTKSDRYWAQNGCRKTLAGVVPPSTCPGR